MELHPFFLGKLNGSSTTACSASESNAKSTIWICRDCRSAAWPVRAQPRSCWSRTSSITSAVGAQSLSSGCGPARRAVAPERSNQRQTGRQAGPCPHSRTPAAPGGRGGGSPSLSRGPQGDHAERHGCAARRGGGETSRAAVGVPLPCRRVCTHGPGWDGGPSRN